MVKKPPLTLVEGAVAVMPEPLAILEQVCGATDRIAEYRALIDLQGPVIITKAGMREHPLVKAEIATRALIGRLITRLGLDIEALRPTPGRPPQGGLGWIPPR